MFEIISLIFECFHFFKKNNSCSGISILKQNLISGKMCILNTPVFRVLH